MAQPPIRIQELFQLSSLGINAQLGFDTVTLESDKFLLVREPHGGQNTVAIIDIANPTQFVRFPIRTADSAIMNPQQRILALKADKQLQIWNIDTQQRIKAYASPEAVSFWRWISASTIAIVTPTAVYHWSMEGTSDPVKMFDRSPNLAEYNIINYRTDAAQKWLALIGILSKPDRMAGGIQLYSVERAATSAIEGHAGCFASYTVEGASKPSTLFAFAARTPAASKLVIVEVAKGDESKEFVKKQIDIFWPQDAVGDFPLAMQISEKFNCVWMLTKMGYIFVFDLTSGETLLVNKSPSGTIFLTTLHQQTGGIVGVNRNGSIVYLTLDEANFIPYLCNVLQKPQIGADIAARTGLPGAEELFSAQFNRAFGAGDYRGAARLAAESPKGVLRTQATIQKFAALQVVPGQPPPVLMYLSLLLERGKLNKIESLELARLVIGQGKVQLLAGWLGEGKLDPSEELGDVIKPYDLRTAMQVYYLGEVKTKVVGCFAETGQFDKIITYCKKVGFNPDWAFLLQNIIAINKQGAVAFAQMLLSNPEGGGVPLVDVNLVVDAFMSRNLVAETTMVLLDYLKTNRAEDAALQTRLLEINLLSQPHVAENIFLKNLFTHYDPQRIGDLCEKAGMFMRALQLYTNVADIKRVIMNTHAIELEFLVSVFTKLSRDDTLDILRTMLANNMRQNLNAVATVAARYAEQLTPMAVIELFESVESWEGLAFVLDKLIAAGSQDKEVHYKYIEACARLGNLKELERMVRATPHFFEPERVRDLLKSVSLKLGDQRPFIIVCDRFGFVPEMTHFLLQNDLRRFIEAYVQKINPPNTPLVVGALLDSDCDEDYIRNLVLSVRGAAPVDELVAEAEKRNRLKLIQPWLEARAAENNTQPGLHNALAKIYVDTNTDAERFLRTNPYYDSRVVGEYCEGRDPALAVVAYRRGLNDEQLIEVTNKHGLLRDQARYLVERKDERLWAKVLAADNAARTKLVQQVVQTALPECQDELQLRTALQSFIAAKLPDELIDLLEKILTEQGSKFYNNPELNNLLLLTSIRQKNQAKLAEYLRRLEKYDAPQIAKLAVDKGFFEEALFIYRTRDFEQHNVLAVGVIIDHMRDLDKAAQFAETVKEPAVWSRLGRAQLAGGQVKEAIASLIKANDHEGHAAVIAAATTAGAHAPLIDYLKMARKKVRETAIESELLFAYAKTNKLAELEEFVQQPNVAQVQQVADRCLQEGLLPAAKVLFTSIPNWPKLASTLVRLEDWGAAVEAAKNAKSMRSWKEVCYACVEAKQLQYAHRCGPHLLTQKDELEELVRFYETRGYQEELMSMIESSLTMPGVNYEIFTQLAILFAKYKPERLMEHLRTYARNVSVSKVTASLQENLMWRELIYLYKAREDYEAAATTMMEHPEDCFEHGAFKDLLAKNSAQEMLYRAVRFYLAEQPLSLNDLLKSIAERVDHTRVVGLVRGSGDAKLPLVQKYLEAVQAANVPAVNEALNELYLDEGDYESLRTSVETYGNFDAPALASQLQRSKLLEFRRIAATIFKRAGNFAESVKLSKEDKLFRDAIQTAAASKSNDVAEELLRFFAAEKNSECFAATLYTCYDLVRPDVALELAWRNGMMDYVFPYLIQTMREFSTKVDRLEKALASTTAGKKKEGEQLVGGDPAAVGAVAGPPVVGFGGVPPVGFAPPVGFGGVPPVGFGGVPPGYGGVPPGSGFVPPGGAFVPPGAAFGMAPPPASMPVPGVAATMPPGGMMPIKPPSGGAAGGRSPFGY